jgi:hypothetical protein
MRHVTVVPTNFVPERDETDARSTEQPLEAD